MRALNVMPTIEDIFRKIESVPDFSMHKIDSVHYRNGYGDTPLHIVSYWGDVQAINILVENGADLNSIGETGYSPLHCAVEQDRIEAVELLLSLGCSQLQDDRGDTPYQMAVERGNKGVIGAFSGYI